MGRSWTDVGNWTMITDYKERKAIPLARGVFFYFPDALCAVAEVSRIGSEQHHPGTGVWWERGKSHDHEDCLLRHLLDKGTLDIDGTRHSAKVAWRALALLQLEIEAENAAQTSKPTDTGRDGNGP
jgi:hypothetical protein